MSQQPGHGRSNFIRGLRPESCSKISKKKKKVEVKKCPPKNDYAYLSKPFASESLVEVVSLSSDRTINCSKKSDRTFLFCHLLHLASGSCILRSLISRGESNTRIVRAQARACLLRFYDVQQCKNGVCKAGGGTKSFIIHARKLQNQ